MAADPSDVPSVFNPQATLERAFMEEYLALHGESIAGVYRRTDPRAHALLKGAATYAAGRLTEVESRAHYLHDIHPHS